MRDILFRGFRSDGWGFVEGSFVKNYVHHASKCTITHGCAVYFEVVPSSVGQYIGRVDEGGVKIFEGDVVRVSRKGSNGVIDMVGSVQYSEDFPGFVLVNSGGVVVSSFPSVGESWLVIGNIHNPDDLWKKKLLITRCSDPMMWYAGKVNQEVELLYVIPEGYMSREDSGMANIVLKGDAEVILSGGPVVSDSSGV